MRLKTFTAPTMAEAMDMVRREMGEDAIIVSTQPGSDGHGARVTAALEVAREEDFEIAAEPEVLDSAESIRHALAFHGTPPRLIDRLVETSGSLEAGNPTLAFAGALDATFLFTPLPEGSPGHPVMLIGPPGAGKTITTAKLAARARLARHSVGVVTTDTRRAGGIEQLEAFTRILQLPLRTAETADQLRTIAAEYPPDAALYVDTAGTNPFSDTEMETLGTLIKAARAEPVLVMAAGGDAMESADIAAAFAAIGASRLLVTRLDMARRLGSILAAADAGHLRFSDVSVTHRVGDGLSAINPVSLARLMMPHAPEVWSSPPPGGRE